MSEIAKRCRQSLPTNRALVYESKCRGGGGIAGSQPMSTAVHITWTWSPNTFWRSVSIFNLSSIYTNVFCIQAQSGRRKRRRLRRSVGETSGAKGRVLGAANRRAKMANSQPRNRNSSMKTFHKLSRSLTNKNFLRTFLGDI
jgi:hypothetical protein